MARRFRFRAIILLAAALALGSCGGVINLPVPVLNSLNPSSVVAGSVQFTLHVTGSGFAPNSEILFDGIPRLNPDRTPNTIFLNQTELTTLVQPTDLIMQTPGAVSVTVFTPAPGGGISAEVTLNVTPSTAPVPQISSIIPSTVLAGVGSATITVNGTNFINTSTAVVNGSNRPTSFQSGIKLVVALNASDIVTAGTVQVAILNPPVQGGNPPGGGLSNAVPVNVVNPSPTVRSLSPRTVVAGAASTTLSVSGTGMDTASQVFVNGSARPTNPVSPTQVTSQLASQDVATAGTFPVQVVNPLPGGGTSSTLLFSVVPSSKGAGLPELVDFSNNGTQADDGVTDPSAPTMDSSGRFIAYASPATNLLLTINQPSNTNPDTNGVPDIFLFDSCLGTTSSCTPRTTLIDSGPNGVIANGAGSDPAMNSSGIELAFISLATNLVPTVTFNGTTPQVFVANTCAGVPSGCTPAVSLISVSGDGVSPANGPSSQVAISGDGRFVAFVSTATNLVATATAGTPEVYLRDTCLKAGGGCTPSTMLISTASGGGPAGGVSGQPSVASGPFGQIVTFSSTATDIDGNTAGTSQVYAVALCIGITTGCTANPGELVSTPDGTAFANGASIEPNINPGGRFIAFASTATNLGAASATTQQIYLRDLCTGQGSVCAPTTSLVSIASDGSSPANGLCESPSMGNTAQFVAFSSLATNLVPATTNGIENVYVRNTCNGFSTGCTQSTALVSESSTGLPGNGQSLNPLLTGLGHEVVFFSAASNLVNNDLNGFADVFLAVTTF
ncbi:MAG TPA: hypothetical protein VJN21_05485 [Candidatus Acidoferrales bacterium]|nr:hypothetical protein [Candidatus Acidoferrales bacterium]